MARSRANVPKKSTAYNIWTRKMTKNRIGGAGDLIMHKASADLSRAKHSQTDKTESTWLGSSCTEIELAWHSVTRKGRWCSGIVMSRVLLSFCYYFQYQNTPRGVRYVVTLTWKGVRKTQILRDILYERPLRSICTFTIPLETINGLA